MADGIEKFDPSTLMQGVKDRIKAQFVSLMPDEVWEKMVKTEIDAFFAMNTSYTKTVEVNVGIRDSWGNNRTATHVIISGAVSPFRALIFEMCLDKCQEFMKKELTDTYLKESYVENKTQYDEGFKKVIQEAMPVAMNKFFEAIALRYTDQLRSDIQNHR